MTDKPILMSALMVRALLDGRKTQTRRLAWRPWTDDQREEAQNLHAGIIMGPGKPTIWQSVKPGDRLYVKEHHVFETPIMAIGQRIFYEADEPGNKMSKWRAGRFMKREFSRLTLIVTATKMERVQEISDDDAIAEGSRIPLAELKPAARKAAWSERQAFSHIWQSLHTKPGARWEDNPEVVALTFTVHQQNIDAMESAA